MGFLSKPPRARGEHMTPELREYLTSSVKEGQSVVVVSTRGPGDGSSVGHVSLSIINGDDLVTVNFEVRDDQNGGKSGIHKLQSDLRTLLTPQMKGQISFNVDVDHFNHAVAFVLPRERTDGALRHVKELKDELEATQGEKMTYSLLAHSQSHSNFNCVLFTRCLLKMMGIDADHLNVRRNALFIPMPLLVNARLIQLRRSGEEETVLHIPEYATGANYQVLHRTNGTMGVHTGISVKNYRARNDGADELTPGEQENLAGLALTARNYGARFMRYMQEMMEANADSFAHEDDVPAVILTGFKMGRLERGNGQSWPFSHLHGLAAAIHSGAMERAFPEAVQAPDLPLEFTVEDRSLPHRISREQERGSRQEINA